ncbi:H-NS histone family protein [Castellaniella sp. GW247-6E4]|uniref:H-NS histone family protein n=1 Tax=Castellaniella sp. GW247-6E4 TaxID=3140380 RepID=UPI003315F9F7
MARASYSTQKLKLEKEITKLQKQMQNLQSKQRAPVIASIVRSMREYDISLEEITAALGRRSGGRPAAQGGTRKAAAKTTKRVIAPKYRHPETQATWTGRGKAPRWITDAEAQGQSRDTFLIQQ